MIINPSTVEQMVSLTSPTSPTDVCPINKWVLRLSPHKNFAYISSTQVEDFVSYLKSQHPECYDKIKSDAYRANLLTPNHSSDTASLKQNEVLSTNDHKTFSTSSTKHHSQQLKTNLKKFFNVEAMAYVKEGQKIKVTLLDFHFYKPTSKFESRKSMTDIVKLQKDYNIKKNFSLSTSMDHRKKPFVRSKKDISLSITFPKVTKVLKKDFENDVSTSFRDYSFNEHHKTQDQSNTGVTNNQNEKQVNTYKKYQKEISSRKKTKKCCKESKKIYVKNVSLHEKNTNKNGSIINGNISTAENSLSQSDGLFNTTTPVPRSKLTRDFTYGRYEHSFLTTTHPYYNHNHLGMMLFHKKKYFQQNETTKVPIAKRDVVINKQSDGNIIQHYLEETFKNRRAYRNNNGEKRHKNSKMRMKRDKTNYNYHKDDLFSDISLKELHDDKEETLKIDHRGCRYFGKAYEVKWRENPSDFERKFNKRYNGNFHIDSTSNESRIDYDFGSQNRRFKRFFKTEHNNFDESKRFDYGKDTNLLKNKDVRDWKMEKDEGNIKEVNIVACGKREHHLITGKSNSFVKVFLNFTSLLFQPPIPLTHYLLVFKGNFRIINRLFYG